LIRHHWIRRRVIIPILELLKQGVTPEKLALSLAIGTVLGVSPILGLTTALAFMICYWFRLNPVAMQLMNYVMYPFQILLFLPFIRAGESLFHADRLRINATQLQQLIHGDAGVAIRMLWTTIWHAVTVWALLSPAAVFLLYLVLKPVLRHAVRTLHVRQRVEPPPPAPSAN
jgi:uncharacterized protein (DUF2062 family)